MELHDPAQILISSWYYGPARPTRTNTTVLHAHKTQFFHHLLPRWLHRQLLLLLRRAALLSPNPRRGGGGPAASLRPTAAARTALFLGRSARRDAAYLMGRLPSLFPYSESPTFGTQLGARLRHEQAGKEEVAPSDLVGLRACRAAASPASSRCSLAATYSRTAPTSAHAAPPHRRRGRRARPVPAPLWPPPLPLLRNSMRDPGEGIGSTRKEAQLQAVEIS